MHWKSHARKDAVGRTAFEFAMERGNERLITIIKNRI